MLKGKKIMRAFTLFSFLLGCSAAPANHAWQSDFRFGLITTQSNVRHELIPQYFDSVQERGDTFYLYYFSRGPTQKQETQNGIKTILFCAGGPGEVFWPQVDQTWLQKLEEDYRVVYFHLRGAGFSQFPESNTYDRYLRTKYAVRDIEKIFDYLKKDDPSFEKWDAVVGFSYGTVLAQQYTARNPTAVKTLVLASPLSRHPFKKQVEDPERTNFVKNIASSYGALLEHVFETDTLVEDGAPTNVFKKQFPKFFTLVERSNYDRKQIIRDIKRDLIEIFNIQDHAVLSANALTDFYDELKTLESQMKHMKGEALPWLQKLAKFDRAFFVDLKDLRKEGWGETVHGENNDVGIAGRALRIAAQILMWGNRKIDVKEVFKEKVHIESADLCKLLSDREWQRNNEQIKTEAGLYGIWCDKVCICRDSDTAGGGRFAGSRRVFYNMAVYDGLDAGFLENWPRTSPLQILDFVKRKDWWYLDPFLRMIGFVTDEVPQVWDPAEPQNQHSVPTLILRGRADPVTEGGQASYIFENALRGPRYLVEFDGIGHELSLGKLQLLSRLPKGAKTGLCGFKKDSAPHMASVDTRACIIESFMNDELETLEDVLVLYHDKFAPSSDQPLRPRISDRPIICEIARSSVDVLISGNQKLGAVAGSICKE